MYDNAAMVAPLVRYASTGDGVTIAYWALGDGPVLIDLPALPHSHIGIEWEIPELRRGFELAASRGTVVRYDGRGTGLSQREPALFSLETMIADLDAVVEEFAGGPVALMGVVNSCPVAIAYASRYPERVSHLILWCPVVDGSVHLGNPLLRASRQIIATDWETFSETVAHGLLGWSESQSARKYAVLIRAGITPEAILRLVPALHELNVADNLPSIRCPTLVLHRPELHLLPPGAAERVAAAIPNARLALFEGRSAAPYLGDWRAIAQTIADFLDGGVPNHAAQGGRALRLLSMRAGSLTPREREIVNLVVRGSTNREIASELFLAEKTVENHIGRILTKLDLRSRAHLAAYAVERGLTDKSA